MNIAKKIIYTGLIGLAALAFFPKESAAKGKTPFEKGIFYFESREDSNENGTFEEDEYVGIHKIGSSLKPLNVETKKNLYLFLRSNPEKSKARIWGKNVKGKQSLENISNSKEESVYEIPNLGDGKYQIDAKGKGFNYVGLPLIRFSE